NGKKNVQRSQYIVHLGEDCMLAVNHRVWCGALFCEMHDRFRLELLHHRREEIEIGNVADKKIDRLSGAHLPNAESLGERTNRRERLHTELVVPLAAQEIIDNGHFVALLREMQGRSPAAITISA